eukprot:TRINITY_DN2368_c0_g1_i4.p2 TRINITY_DN2368_c0_g1~~TRINITY_DN2368_c0_g1_i4.p2  ORF type:complete len:100 (+),score=35.79 TRINITY_DN2368_c0_g1_i4:103-402(+)
MTTCFFFFFLMIRRPPRSTQSRSSAASDVYKRQYQRRVRGAQQIAHVSQHPSPSEWPSKKVPVSGSTARRASASSLPRMAARICSSTKQASDPTDSANS